MTLVVGGALLVVVAIVVAVLAPRLLTRAAWTIDRPRTAITAWAASVLVGTGGLVAGVTLVLVGADPHRDVLHLDDSPTRGVHLAVAVAAVAAFLIAVRVRPSADHAAVRAAIRSGAAPLGRVDGAEVAMIDADHSLACAVPGRGVLVSTGLRARLTADQFDAVVAHEAAHLRGHHQVVVQVAESIERTVPWVPGARAMAGATRVLVEFAADDAAARRVGASAIADAVIAADGGTALARVRAERLLAR